MSDQPKVYSVDLNKFADELGKIAGHKMTREDAWAKGLCVNCGKEAIPRCYSSAGMKEYRMSGLCEVCFDTMWEEEE